MERCFARLRMPLHPSFFDRIVLGVLRLAMPGVRYRPLLLFFWCCHCGLGVVHSSNIT